MHGEQGDDQLRRVAEGRVEEAADARSRVLGGVLGRLADQPRQWDEREGGEHELDRLREVGEEVESDRERREGERREEDSPDHGRRTLSTCSTVDRR